MRRIQALLLHLLSISSHFLLVKTDPVPSVSFPIAFADSTHEVIITCSGTMDAGVCARKACEENGLDGTVRPSCKV